MYSGIPSGQFIKPDAVVSHFHFREGDKVADFGAGTGFYMSALSKVVGGDGRVYMCEIQKNLVEAIGTKAREAHLSNIEPIWCDLEKAGGTKLRDQSLDGGILVNTLFQLEERDSSLNEIARTLRSGAKFFVIDWSESFGGMGPHPDAVITESAARDIVGRHGFAFERSFPAGDHHYGLAFRKV